MPTKARDYTIQKKLSILLKKGLFIHNGQFLKKRKLSKSYKNIILGSLSPTKKTGKSIHFNNKKKNKKKK